MFLTVSRGVSEEYSVEVLASSCALRASQSSLLLLGGDTSTILAGSVGSLMAMFAWARARQEVYDVNGCRGVSRPSGPRICLLRT